MIKVILTSLVFAAQVAYAQSPGDALGTAGITGSSAGATYDGAKNNFNDMSNHKDEAGRWQKEANAHRDADGHPNREMMRHFHHEMRLARESGLQAREFAKEALQALSSRSQQTSANAAPARMPDGSSINIPLLQKIANLPITNEPDDNMNSDAEGSFINADNPTTTSQGAPDANPVTAPPPTAQVVYVGSQPGTITGGGTAVGARSLTLPGSRFGSSNSALEASTPNSQKPDELKAQSTDIVAADHIVTPADGQKDKKTLEANRALIMRQMGLRSPASVEESGPYRAKTEDIFAVMHSHYQNMNSVGLFYDVRAVIPPSPGPSRNPPTFKPGW